MTPKVVQFSTRPGSFRVNVDQCSNVDCECADVTFCFKEIDSPAAAPLVFEVRVNPETWAEIGDPHQSTVVAGMAKEFLRDYPAEARRAMAERAARKRVLAKRLKEYRIDMSEEEFERGTLVAFSDIASEKGSICSGGSSFYHRFMFRDREFFVDDMYCGNPECNCQEAHLRFFDYIAGKGNDDVDQVREAFVATVSFDGRAIVEDYCRWDRAEADEAVAAWLLSFKNDLPLLKWRNGKVKEIARRSRPKAARSPRILARNTRHVALEHAMVGFHPAGRNDPCPCGSGKKYKRCCGA